MQTPSVSLSFSKQQQVAASCSQHHHVVNLWQTSNVGSFGKLERGDASSSNVERSLLKGKRDREFGSVSSSQHEQGENPHENFENAV